MDELAEVPEGSPLDFADEDSSAPARSVGAAYDVNSRLMVALLTALAVLVVGTVVGVASSRADEADGSALQPVPSYSDEHGNDVVAPPRPEPSDASSSGEDVPAPTTTERHEEPPVVLPTSRVTAAPALTTPTSSSLTPLTLVLSGSLPEAPATPTPGTQGLSSNPPVVPLPAVQPPSGSTVTPPSTTVATPPRPAPTTSTTSPPVVPPPPPTTAAPRAGARPSNLSVIEGETTAVVAWDLVGSEAGIGGFEVAWEGGREIRSAGERRFQLGGLAAGTRYTVTITALAANGSPDRSAAQSIGFDTKRPVATGTGPAVGIRTSSGRGSITVSWSDSGANGGYFVSWGSPSGFVNAVALHGGERSHTITGLTSGVTYTIDIQTFDQNFLLKAETRRTVVAVAG